MPPLPPRSWFLCGLLLLGSCGGDESPSEPDGDGDDQSLVASNIDITPESPPSLQAIGATVQLSAVVEDQFERPMTGAPVSWASLDAEVVTVGSTGLVTAVANGFTFVVASSGSARDTVAVGVAQVAAALRLVAQPSNELIDARFETQPVVETLDANGHAMPDDTETIVTVALAQGSGTLTGTMQESAQEGRVTFFDLAITGASGEHQLSFSADDVTPITSDLFSVFAEPIATGTGYLKNSNVGGITYRSGAVTGVTDNDGRYQYDTNLSVTFSVGAVTLGTTDPGEFLTMVDLVEEGSSDSPEVLNLVRFLMMLDSDGDPNNGIDVSSEVRTAAADWTLSFDDASFDSGIQAIASSAQTADGGSHALPSQTDARNRIEATFRCVQSGGFRGTWTETVGLGETAESGPLYAIIDAGTGAVEGAVFKPSTDEILTFSGSSVLSVDRTRTFVSGNLSNGLSFSGRLNSFGRMSGTYSEGTWSATRVTNSIEAVHRYTGNFTGDDSGIFYVELDASDNLTGTTYSVRYDELFEMAGSLNGTALTFSIPSASTNGSGTLDKSSGTTSGTWSNAGGSGSFSGSGCKVN